MTYPAPPSPLLLTGDRLFSLRLVLHIMGKRSRGPPPGTEERKAKRQRRELRQPRKYAFGEVEGMRQAGYYTWAVTPPVPENKRFSVVVRGFVDALQRHTGRRVQAKDEAAAHAMQRVLFVPELGGSTRGIRAAITQKGPDQGMRLWVQGRPEMVALFATVVENSTVAEALWRILLHWPALGVS